MLDAVETYQIGGNALLAMGAAWQAQQSLRKFDTLIEQTDQERARRRQSLRRRQVLARYKLSRQQFLGRGQHDVYKSWNREAMAWSVVTVGAITATITTAIINYGS